MVQCGEDSLYNPIPEMLYYTHDGGQTFDLVFSNKKGDPGCINNVVFTDREHGRLFGERNIYYTNDAGATWKKDSVVGNIGSMDIGEYYYIDSTTSYFREFRGFVWKYFPGSVPVGVSEPVTTPVSACPTPFTESTVVKYTLETAGAVTIRVMNSMGEKVTEREFFAQPGEREFSISGVDLPAGVYFCDIITNGKTYRAKTVLVR
jgi:hypothetical protein